MDVKLKKRREELNLTQKQVAERCGIKESHYQGYENDRHAPIVSMAIKIAKALETTVESLWGD